MKTSMRNSLATKSLVLFVSALLMGLSISTPVQANTSKRCTDGLIIKFGQSCTYSGVSYTVYSARSWYPTDYGACSGKVYAKFQIKVVNKSRKIVKFNHLGDVPSSSSGDGDECFNSSENLPGTPDSGLLPGRTKSFVNGYGFKSLKELTFQLSIDPFYTYSGPAVYWTK